MASSDHDRADIALSDEAIEWLVRLHSGRATEADRAAFIHWRQRGEAHEMAAREAEAIWHGLGIAGSAVRRRERQAGRTRVTRRLVIGGLGLGAAGLALERSGLIGARLFADHVTGVGERRTLTLADGSTVLMNACTALGVDLGKSERRLTLLEGQALFTVAPDAARPFIVAAAGGATRAVGTVFDVDLRPDDVVVTVLEGRVSVARDADAQAPTLAGADQQVSYSATRLSPARPVDARMATAWRRGKLIVNQRPLAEVVAEIERYRPGTILIANPALGELEVTGVFDLAGADAILDTIEQTLPVRITRLPLVTIIR
ncbi:FecR family protein [Ancylobacter sp. WKF20]|uniref:FecR family protein n=1 Tax=Ancylobacter sp. WKF20 TaxID=3039801 RepID=UPI0024343EF2|nr:FecR family protein [Ancylobacter sp. WKF20]WGD30703.1 FecR family protein [Ancylobacter sp. WKF20]